MLAMVGLLNDLGRWLAVNLGRMSLELTILAAIVLAALYILRVKSPAARHLFLGLLLAKPVVTLLVASPLSLYGFLWPPTPEFIAAPSVVSVTSALPPVEYPERMAPAANESPAPVAATPSPPFWSQFDRYGILSVAWTLIAGALGIRLLLGCAYVAFLRGTAHRQHDGPLSRVVTAASQTLRLRRHVHIATTCVAHGPVLAGIFRPVILLPETMTAALTPEQLKLVVTHELVHARRWDNLVLLIQRLAEMFLFFHPVVWLCGWMMRREAEAACDDAVVNAYGEADAAAAYAESLTRVAEMKCGITHRLLVNTFAAAESNFNRRIRRILSGRSGRMTLWLSLVTGAVLILIGVLGLPTVSSSRETEAAGKNTAAPVNPAAAPAPKKAAPVVPLDPATAEAVRQIEAKLGALQSYSCTLTLTDHFERADRSDELEAHMEEAYKRPCRFKIRVTNVKYPVIGHVGAVTDIVVDGQTWVERHQNVPGSGQKMLDAMKSKPVMSAEEFIILHDTPTSTGKDLKAWLQSGFTEDDLAEQVYSKILKPFARCDMATLKIESENDSQWTFLARFQQTKGGVYDFARVTIGKADGIRKEARLGRDDDTGRRIERVDRIELNPDLPDTFFQITSTPGANAGNIPTQSPSEEVTKPPEQTSAQASNDASASWRTAFEQVYSLKEGEVLKRIAPPFIPERMERYLAEIPGQAASMPQGPRYMAMTWDKGRVLRTVESYGCIPENPVILGEILLSLTDLSSDRLDIPDGLLTIGVHGDWVVRDGAETQTILKELARILHEELNCDLEFAKEDREREVIVASGAYAFTPVPDVTGNDQIHLFADVFDLNSGEGGSAGTTIPEFLRTVEDRIGQRIIDETTPTPEKTNNICFHPIQSLNEARAKAVTEKDGRDLERLRDLFLANVAKQTGLQFRIERRTVPVWTIAGDRATIRLPAKNITHVSIFQSAPRPEATPAVMTETDGKPSSVTETTTPAPPADGTPGAAGGNEDNAAQQANRGKITGVVTAPDGRPIVGAYVGVGDFGDSGGSNHDRHRQEGLYANAKTDDQGRFMLDGLAFGDAHPLFVTHPDYVRHDERVVLSASQPSVVVACQLEPAARINVTVVDASGVPAPGQYLFRLKDEKGFRHIPPGMDPHLSAFASTAWTRGPREGAFSFTELPEGTYIIDVIRAAPASQLLSGGNRRVLDDKATVYYGGIAASPVKTGQIGDLQIGPQEHGTRLVCTMPANDAFPPDFLRIFAIGRSSELPFEAKVKIQSLEDPKLGRIAEGALFHSLMKTDSFTVANLPPGEYTIFAGPILELDGARVQLAPGQDVRVELPAEPGASEQSSAQPRYEKIDPRGGEVVDGLQVVLRTEKERWAPGEKPEMIADFLVVGEGATWMEDLPLGVRIEYDGVQYAARAAGKPSAPALFGRGSLYDFRGLLDSELVDSKDQALTLTPGRHTIRLAIPTVLVKGPESTRELVFSNPVSIVIGDAAEAASSFADPDIPKYTVEAKVLSGPAETVERFVNTLPSIKETLTTPEDTRTFLVPDHGGGQALLEELQRYPDLELLSAPRVTFVSAEDHEKHRANAAAEPALFPSEKYQNAHHMPRSPTPPEIWDLTRGDYSESLAVFWRKEEPVNLIADLTSYYFTESGAEVQRSLPAGIVVAAVVHKTDTPEIVDLRLYFNLKEVTERSRGLAFWRPRPLPDIFESPVTITMPFRLGECIGFVATNRDPEKKTLVLLTLEQSAPV